MRIIDFHAHVITKEYKEFLDKHHALDFLQVDSIKLASNSRG